MSANEITGSQPRAAQAAGVAVAGDAAAASGGTSVALRGLTRVFGQEAIMAVFFQRLPDERENRGFVINY